jgi:hypothetical protein
MNRPLSVVIVTVLLLGSLNQMHAQEHGDAVGSSNLEHHKNHGATFLGATTYLGDDVRGQRQVGLAPERQGGNQLSLVHV